MWELVNSFIDSCAERNGPCAFGSVLASCSIRHRNTHLWVFSFRVLYGMWIAALFLVVEDTWWRKPPTLLGLWRAESSSEDRMDVVAGRKPGPSLASAGPGNLPLSANVGRWMSIGWKQKGLLWPFLGCVQYGELCLYRVRPHPFIESALESWWGFDFSMFFHPDQLSKQDNSVSAGFDSVCVVRGRIMSTTLCRSNESGGASRSLTASRALSQFNLKWCDTTGVMQFSVCVCVRWCFLPNPISKLPNPVYVRWEWVLSVWRLILV